MILLLLFFKILGYVHRDRVARTQAELPFLICSKNEHAKTDVCIFDCSQKEYLLLVQKERRVENRGIDSLQARLVAAAVAAFNENNWKGQQLGSVLCRKKWVIWFINFCWLFFSMPGIVMVGTLPAFINIPVTQTLSTHIRHGTYPQKATRVTSCHPPLDPKRLHIEGMKNLGNRRDTF